MQPLKKINKKTCRVEVCDLPVRAAKFVARKNWVMTGSVSVKIFF